MKPKHPYPAYLKRPELDERARVRRAQAELQALWAQTQTQERAPTLGNVQTTGLGGLALGQMLIRKDRYL